MDTLLYTKDEILLPSLCNEIIEHFNNIDDDNKYDGVTSSGTNKNVKDTLDCAITTFVDNDLYWKNTIETVKDMLLDNVKIYLKEMELKHPIMNFEMFKGRLFFDTILFQRYTKNKGKFTYHQDGSCKYNENKTRVITFLFYLNDVDEGGETEVFGGIKIQPRTGKLLLFPANWCFPHCGLVPLSGNKYILTGWIYINIV